MERTLRELNDLIQKINLRINKAQEINNISSIEVDILLDLLRQTYIAAEELKNTKKEYSGPVIVPEKQLPSEEVEFVPAMTFEKVQTEPEKVEFVPVMTFEKVEIVASNDEEHTGKEQEMRDQVETDRMEGERLEREHLETERMEGERLERERLETERMEGERLERERLAAVHLELERLGKEQERVNAEIARAERERIEREQLEIQQLEKERYEKEEFQRDQQEQERLESEQILLREPVIERDPLFEHTPMIEPVIERELFIDKRSEHDYMANKVNEKEQLFSGNPATFQFEKKQETSSMNRKAGDLFGGTTIADKLKNEKPSLIDKISGGKADQTIAHKMQLKPIADLKTAIGINEKFQFVNDLFEGRIDIYNESINHLNSCSTADEALRVFEGMKSQHKWNEDLDAFGKLSSFVNRRYL